MERVSLIVDGYMLDWIIKCAALTNLCEGEKDKEKLLAQETHRCLASKAFASDTLSCSVPAIVDQVWHNMILDTAMYERYCRMCLGGPFLHHTPFTADDTEEKKRKLLTFYVNVYQTEPDKSVSWIWGEHMLAPAVRDNKKRRVKKGPKVAEDKAPRKAVSYTYDGKQHTLDIIGQVSTSDVRRILSFRHCADVILRPGSNEEEMFPIPRPAEMQIFVKGLDGKVSTYWVKSAATILDLKVVIKLKDAICVDAQRLIYSGKQLEDGVSFAKYDIQPDSTLHLVQRLRGC